MTRVYLTRSSVLYLPRFESVFVLESSKMFECTLEGLCLKRIIEALKDTCSDVVLVCGAEGCSMQAMDESHVALVCMTWTVEMFHKYRCDSKITLGKFAPVIFITAGAAAWYKFRGKCQLRTAALLAWDAYMLVSAIRVGLCGYSTYRPLNIHSS